MRILACLFIAAALAGCSKGPDEAALQKDVSERLAQALPAGTVSLASLERRGSQGDTKAPSGETRRIVYFDAELKLDRDFDFGAWDSPGVAGVVSALGAGPRGIVGLESGGNKAGDVVRAHGTALYKRDGDAWVPVTAGGYAPANPPLYATDAARGGAVGILDAMRKIVETMPRDVPPASRVVIERELTAAHAALRSAVARVTDGYGIAAGAEHGQYLRFAQALSAVADVRAIPLVTRGGEDNLRMLRDGKVAFAMSQADAALAAYEGTGSFAEEGPYLTLRAVGSLYPEPLHVLVAAGSPITSMAELAGKRVAVGEPGSASRGTALRVLQAHGLAKNVQPRELPLGDALVALRDGQVDAVMQVIGAPADSVRDALAQIPLRLIPLSGPAIATLAGAKTGYVEYTIPRGAYAGQEQDVRTIATAALMLAAPHLSETEVEGMARILFSGSHDFAAHGSAQGTQVAAANARLGLPVPLHVGAAKALEQLAAKTAPGAPAGK